MEFYRRTNKVDKVPIVPLIDILTILLIFFIVTPKKESETAETKNPPPEPRPVVHIELPTVKEVPTSEVLETRAILTVTPDGLITLDNYELANPELLTDALIVFRREFPQRKLELAADQGVTLSQLFMVWDALTAAGLEIKDVPARIRLPAEVPFIDPLQR
jgi:biopolymer transport protein ExbD